MFLLKKGSPKIKTWVKLAFSGCNIEASIFKELRGASLSSEILKQNIEKLF